MIDLEKEFRTLRLLSKALIIIGLGLTVCGFGAALMMNSGKEKPKKVYVPPPDDGSDAPPGESDDGVWPASSPGFVMLINLAQVQGTIAAVAALMRLRTATEFRRA